MLTRHRITILALGAVLAACGGSSSAPPPSSAAVPVAPEPIGPTAPPEEPEEPLRDVEVVAELDQAPGNITVTPSGRIVMSLHQFYEPKLRVATLEDGKLVPFAAGARVDAVLGIQADREGVVWMLDNGMRSNKPRRVIGWDAEKDRKVADIAIGKAAPKDAFLNDLVVDRDHDAIYIADPAGGANAALIVVDIKTRKARRVLEGHESVVPRSDLDLVVDDTPVRVRTPAGEEIRPHIGVNPIAADAQNEWLYYGPMHGDTLYRVRTADLRDASLAPAALAERVERWAERPISDGIAMDDAGNIYISDIGANAVGVIDADRQYRLLAQDPRLSWPDAFSFGADGKLYVVANQLHRTARLNAGTQTATPPFHVLRLEPLATGVTGR